MPTTRRTFLAQALGAAGLLTLSPFSALARSSFVVANISQLYPVEVARIALPRSTEEVAREVRAWGGKVAVGGGRYSMGGQTAVALGLHLDMRGMNRLLHFDPVARTVRVQAGMTWRDLQDALDPAGLSVKSMQSYSNFTIGGAVSVNAHGRYTGTGPVGSTVRALRMVLADGAIVDASPNENTELFRAVVGGYGAVGVITEVELELVENCRIERVVVPLTLDTYRAYFTRQVRDAHDVVMHNADLLPPHFNEPVAVSWRRTDKALTETARLVPRGQRYRVSQAALEVATEAPYGDLLVRHVLHPLMRSGGVVKWRNHEASLDVNELEPASRAVSTYALQEYFVPVARFESFAREMAAVIRAHGAQVLNVSVRHTKADPVPLLAWAKEEVFSFVVYYKQQTSASACAAVGEWTRAMIASALRHGGRYYLPYQLHATKAQFEQAYPDIEALRRVKRALDPEGKFSNAMWARYL
ncbi:Decaprenylphosphoryl-beta-D-ribose oxidase [Massilia sp. Bi118]|uniref:FAD-binding protein n=1 Tax=Massilia sp. Bi118 TaxID=2822346 RepID=UPI001D36A698|nr:FAD-binding protein [Massilia sp. Bi118]CAH0152752.1 Decaprenylphosphoryl-beta-D-ribose oxidase [Massilia sp. Bi118]